jgi:hypothetical protein
MEVEQSLLIQDLLYISLLVAAIGCQHLRDESANSGSSAGPEQSPPFQPKAEEKKGGKPTKPPVTVPADVAPQIPSIALKFNEQVSENTAIPLLITTSITGTLKPENFAVSNGTISDLKAHSDGTWQALLYPLYAFDKATISVFAKKGILVDKKGQHNEESAPAVVTYEPKGAQLSSAVATFKQRSIERGRYHDGSVSASEIFAIDVPYSPFGTRNGPDAVVITRYETSSSNVLFAAKFPEIFATLLPAAVKEQLKQEKFSDIELYFVIQDAQGTDDGAIFLGEVFDPANAEKIPAVKAHFLVHSWAFTGQDLPPHNFNYGVDIRSGIFDTANGFLHAHAPAMNRSMQDDHVSIHPAGPPPRDNTIFSGPTGQITGSEWGKNYGFWSVVVAKPTGKTAVTLHWNIVNTDLGDVTDIAFSSGELRTYLSGTCLPAACTFQDFLAELTRLIPPTSDARHEKTKRLVETITDFPSV